MSTIQFESIIEIRDGNPYVLVPEEKVKQIKPNWKKPLPVLIQVNGKPDQPWAINMMPVGTGEFYLYLHGDVRKASTTKVGDRVTVSICFNESYRNGPMHPMPEWFQSALEKHPAAKKSWEELIPSRQKEILRYFSWLQSQEAIDRNLTKAMTVLSGQPGRFLGRSWENGK